MDGRNAQGNAPLTADPTQVFASHVRADQQAKIVERYAQAYVDTGTWAAAFRRTHDCSNMKPATVWKSAHTLSNFPGVRERVRELLDEAAERTIVSAAQLLARQLEIATADPSEITWITEHPCRYCHGIDNLYQWRDQDEFSEACAAELDRAAEMRCVPKLPSDAGGYGFTAHREPNPECEHCKGVGEPAVHVRATRELSGPAAKLVKSVGMDRFGQIKVTLHDQQKALDAIARIIGANKDGVTIRKPPETTDIPVDATQEQVAEAYLSLVQ